MFQMREAFQIKRTACVSHQVIKRTTTSAQLTSTSGPVTASGLQSMSTTGNLLIIYVKSELRTYSVETKMIQKMLL